jgi:hypothetical protein
LASRPYQISCLQWRQDMDGDRMFCTVHTSADVRIEIGINGFRFYPEATPNYILALSLVEGGDSLGLGVRQHT